MKKYTGQSLRPTKRPFRDTKVWAVKIDGFPSLLFATKKEALVDFEERILMPVWITYNPSYEMSTLKKKGLQSI